MNIIDLRRLAAPLVAALVLLAAPCAKAQLVDDVDFRRDGADAVLQIRFVTPVQYRRATVPRAGDTALAFYDVVTTRELPRLLPSERRVRGGGAMPDFTVSDESAGGDATKRRLSIRLSKAVPFQVRAGKGDRTIELLMPGLGASVPATVNPEAAAAVKRRGAFQIALQRSDSPNLQLDTPIPAQLQRYQVFTGRRVVDGATVYEVSIGDFADLVEAEAALNLLRRRFPQATLVPIVPAAPTPAAAPPAAPAPAAPPAAAPPVQAAASAPAEIDAQAAALLDQARAAEAQQDHATALARLNQLLNLPANASTREGQELAGNVRERSGDVVRARAEYETFLQLFPTGPDADRVRAALARLPAAAPAPAPKPLSRAEATSTISGSVSAFFFGGASKIRTQEFQDSPISGLPELVSDETLSGVDQEQLQTSADLNWRYRSSATDMRFVFRDSYTADLRDKERSRNRLSALYFEHRSLAAGTSARIGRQSPTGGGVLGRFDGIQAGYTFVPKWRANIVAGVPADKLLDSKRHFYGLWVDADALGANLGGSLYANRQVIDGETDRSAVGAEMRYFSGGVSATGILDVDTAIRGLNIASLQGTWQREDNTVINLLLDRRKTPLLMLGNALFFQDPTQPLARRIDELLDAGATLDSLRDRVRATTSNTIQGLLGVTTPINPTWQVGADLRLSDVGEISPVADILPAGQGRNRNVAVGAQLIGTNLYSSRDTHVFNASLQRGTSYSLLTDVPDTYDGLLLSYNNSSQVNALLTLEPSLRLYLQKTSTGVKTQRLSPGLRLTWRVGKQVALESDLNAEISKLTGPSRDESSSRLYYYLGGRYDF